MCTDRQKLYRPPFRVDICSCTVLSMAKPFHRLSPRIDSAVCCARHIKAKRCTALNVCFLYMVSTGTFEYVAVRGQQSMKECLTHMATAAIQVSFHKRPPIEPLRQRQEDCRDQHLSLACFALCHEDGVVGSPSDARLAFARWDE